MFLLVKQLQIDVVLWLYNFVLLSSHGACIIREKDEIVKCVCNTVTVNCEAGNKITHKQQGKTDYSELEKKVHNTDNTYNENI
jgi:hypothetical protein